VVTLEPIAYNYKSARCRWIAFRGATTDETDLRTDGTR
jgi:hypothetical protein